MQPSSRIVAQGLGLVVALGTLLPWATFDDRDSVSGVSLAPGTLVLFAGLVAIVLVQMNIRAAWIAPGFAVAVAGRELASRLGDAGTAPGIGLWISVIAAVAAAVLLIRQMFASIERVSPDQANTSQDL